MDPLLYIVGQFTPISHYIDYLDLQGTILRLDIHMQININLPECNMTRQVVITLSIALLCFVFICMNVSTDLQVNDFLSIYIYRGI